MPGDLERIGRKEAMQEDLDVMWAALRNDADRVADIADAIAILTDLVEWVIVALPGQKTEKDKGRNLLLVDEVRALLTEEAPE